MPFLVLLLSRFFGVVSGCFFVVATLSSCQSTAYKRGDDRFFDCPAPPEQSRSSQWKECRRPRRRRSSLVTSTRTLSNHFLFSLSLSLCLYFFFFVPRLFWFRRGTTRRTGVFIEFYWVWLRPCMSLIQFLFTITELSWVQEILPVSEFRISFVSHQFAFGSIGFYWLSTKMSQVLQIIPKFYFEF